MKHTKVRPMRHRPILFSGPMVRAILEGRKTQTRRVVTRRTKDGLLLPVDFRDGLFWFADGDSVALDSPYGLAGDRLWVRETFALETNEGADGCAEFAAPKDGRPIRHHAAINECDSEYDLYPRYRATEAADLTCEHEKCNADGGPCQHPWRPSIFMPRWASRITPEITDVRVQRLQDISEEDAQAEGVDPFVTVGTARDKEWYPEGYRANFKLVWDSINAKRAPWASNPWVWALTFRVLGDESRVAQ